MKKSYCPIFEGVNIIGDKWSILIIRDIMFHGKRHFNDFLASDEKIAKNILSNRLKKLIDNVIIVKAPDNSHKQKNKYTLTHKGIDLIPFMIELYKWNGYSSYLSEKDNKLYTEIRDNRFRFAENLKKSLTVEIKLVYDTNRDLFIKTLRKISPDIKTMAEWENERNHFPIDSNID